MTEATATLIGGTFLVFLCQVLKRAFHLSGNAMRWVAVGASVVVAGGAMLWQGELLFSDPETLLTGGLAMLGLSQSRRDLRQSENPMAQGADSREDSGFHLGADRLPQASCTSRKGN